MVAYFINITIFTYTFLKKKSSFKTQAINEKIPFSNLIGFALKNKVFLYLIIGQILFVFGYNIMSSILPQYFAIHPSQLEASKLFAFLLSVNGVTGLTCQYFVYKFSQITTIKTAIIIGSILMPTGLFFMGALNAILLQCLSMVLFTLGEMLVFTMIDIRIDELSELSIN